MKLQFYKQVQYVKLVNTAECYHSNLKEGGAVHNLSKKKSKGVPLHAMEAHGGEEV
jgi:hypothetical protein